MFPILIETYVMAFGVLLPALLITLVIYSAHQAGLTAQSLVRLTLGITAVLALWFGIAVPMAKAGYMMPPPTLADPPIILVFMLGGAGILFALARFTQTGRRITDTTDQSLLIGFQSFRVMGGIFLLGWAFGYIPWEFALPAGLGDVWAGIAGYRAMQSVRRGDEDAHRRVFWANIIGLGDFVVAVLTGLMTSEGFLHLLSRDAPNIINQYPLALFPAFFVALFMAVHFVSLARLRDARFETAPA